MNKSRILEIFKFLWENTDENHPATVKDINDSLEKHSLSADRKTIYKDIDTLIDYGVDIVVNRLRSNEYYIGDRIFELSELKMLVDQVQSAKFISRKKSKELIEKISKFAGKEQKAILGRELYVSDRVKMTNEQIYYIIDGIQRAMEENKKISFQYSEYLPNKKKVAKHNGQVYTLSPYGLMWNEDNYYVVGYSERHGKIVNFRVDRIMQPVVITKDDIIERPRDFDMSEYCTKVFSMYMGEEAEVELLVENSLMDSIIDKFGEDVRTELVDKDHFKVIQKVSLSRTFYAWVFTFQGDIKIIKPERAAKEFNKMLKQF